ncbi:MAG: thiamine pyrophosphate-dependent dehydrogenase E1 component subunit alpha [Thermoproteota archaeon]|jgi:Pyruvate/2-oxoglutarate dehydrogenase complex, dehydrogenase (E1) component, eukaryotic type, alpha subunit
MSYFQILNERGEPNEVLLKTVDLRNEDLYKFYKYMLTARILDSWMLRLQRMGKVALHGPNEGQEAIGAGTGYAARPEDWFFPSYRQISLLITRGVKISDILNRWMANKYDVMKGHEFNLYGFKDFHIVTGTTPIAVHIPSAVGFAHAAKIRKEKIVVLVYFGDGATSKGDFHEAINWAGVFKLPVFFVCENNQYAISQHVSRQTASETLAIKGVAYGVKSMRVDGNDVLAVYKSAKEAIESARNYEPVFVEYLTYRLGAHTTADDPRRYRSDEEVNYWRTKEPLIRLKNFLISQGIMTESEEKSLRQELEATIEEEVKKAVEIPPPPIEVIFEDVYSDMPWHLKEQMETVVKEYKEEQGE